MQHITTFTSLNIPSVTKDNKLPISYIDEPYKAVMCELYKVKYACEHVAVRPLHTCKPRKSTFCIVKITCNKDLWVWTRASRLCPNGQRTRSNIEDWEMLEVWWAIWQRNLSGVSRLLEKSVWRASNRRKEEQWRFGEVESTERAWLGVSRNQLTNYNAAKSRFEILPISPYTCYIDSA